VTLIALLHVGGAPTGTLQQHVGEGAPADREDALVLARERCAGEQPGRDHEVVVVERREIAGQRRVFLKFLGRFAHGIRRAYPGGEKTAHVRAGRSEVTMGLIELLIVILLLLWLFGYFGRGRMYARGPAVTTGGWYGGGWIHTLLVIVVILVILRLLGVG